MAALTNHQQQAVRTIRVAAEREVAFTSPDHVVPWGTRRDNSRNWRFNQKLNKLFGNVTGPLWLLDLGCSGAASSRIAWTTAGWRWD